MKSLLNRKYLFLSITICLLISFLSLFFLPVDEYKWGIPVISFIASFIVSFFVVAFSKKGSKKKTVIIRYMLAALVIISTCLYIYAWKKIVCKITIKQIKNEQVYTSYKNIITGTDLIDKSDDEINQINKSKDRCSICSMVNENNPEKIWSPGSVWSSKIKLYAAFLLLLVTVAVLLVYLAVEILLRNTSVEIEDKVFISYNHEDQRIAAELCNGLLQHDMELVVDSPNTAQGDKVQNMNAGDDIYSFIKRSILGSKITLMIVSEHSLLSGWVATETINSFFLESFDEKKSFIACYVDNSFMNIDFPNRAYIQIDQKLDVINKEIQKRIEQQADSRDLNDQKTRLLMLRGNLDKTIQRLQNSLCVDISNEQLPKNLPSIIKAIRLKFKSDS